MILQKIYKNQLMFAFYLFMDSYHLLKTLESNNHNPAPLHTLPDKKSSPIQSTQSSSPHHLLLRKHSPFHTPPLLPHTARSNTPQTKHFPPPTNLALDKVQNSTYTSRRLNSCSLSSQSYLRAFDRPHQNGDNNQQSHYTHTELLSIQ